MTPLPDNFARNADIRINVNEPYEVRHWAKQLGVSIDQLRIAIEQSGPLVDAVRLRLKNEIHPDNPWYPRSYGPESAKKEPPRDDLMLTLK